MADWDLPIEGSCRCGRLRLKISAPPIITMACHCTGCRKMTSSAFSLSVAVPSESLTVEGETVIGGLKGEIEHTFCASCLSWSYSRMPAMGWFTNVRAGLLDRPERFAPYIETWTDEKLPFAQAGASVSYPGFPPMEAFEALAKAFAETSRG